MAPRFRLIFILIPAMIFSFPFHSLAQHKDKQSKNERSRNEGEEEEPYKHWQFGINIGGFYANRYSANFYNGSDDNPNKISYVMSNKYWYQDIFYLVKATDTVFVKEVPQNMHYSFAFTGGMFIRYNINRNDGVFFSADYAKLKAEEGMTFQVDPATYLTEQDIRLYPVRGSEYRVNFDLGYQHNFRFKSKIYLFVQGGLHLNYTRVLQNSVFIEGQEFSMIDIYGSQYYVPNTNLQENVIIQGGVGYGFFAGIGAGFPLTDYFCLEPGVTMHVSNVNLEGYKDLTPSATLYLRFIFENLF